MLVAEVVTVWLWCGCVGRRRRNQERSQVLRRYVRLVSRIECPNCANFLIRVALKFLPGLSMVWCGDCQYVKLEPPAIKVPVIVIRGEY